MAISSIAAKIGRAAETLRNWVRPGDLILWGCNPDRTGRTQAGNPMALRRALLMVTRVVGSGVAVRLLQDWGGVE